MSTGSERIRKNERGNSNERAGLQSSREYVPYGDESGRALCLFPGFYEGRDRKSGLCPDTPRAVARAWSNTVVDFLMKINNLYNEVKNKPEEDGEDNVISVNCS